MRGHKVAGATRDDKRHARPLAKRISHLTPGRLAIALLASLTLAAPLAHAEEADEMLIGTFKLRGTSPAAEAPPPSAPVPANSNTSAPETVAPAPGSRDTASKDTPADQLGAALALFAAGDRDGGQRTLEVLVATWPQAPESAHARRALADLYRPAASRPPERLAAPAPAAAESASPSVDTPPADGWTAEVRRNNGLDRRFILEAGDRVFFGEHSAELGARARTVLAAQASWLDQRPDVVAVIEGHADEPGTDATNLALSQRRAEAVRDRLIEEGVGPDRLRAVGLGRGQRLAQCDEPECAAQNRRVVTAIFTRDGTGPAPSRSPLSSLPKPATERDSSATLLATVAPVLRPRR